MRGLPAHLAFSFLVFAAISPSEAQSLKVSPITIDLPQGANSAVVTLEADKKEGVAVQARVFRWSQADGEDKLEKTEDVVISPPMLTIRGGVPSTVRLVRVAKATVSGEETYRLLIDEIPDRKNLQSGNVTFTIRQSFPVFFTGGDVRAGSLAWKVAERMGKLVLEATNGGQKRVKLWALRVTDEQNRPVLKMDGLAGYVLGGQTKSWPIAGQITAKTFSIKAESDTGPVNASAIAGRSG